MIELLLAGALLGCFAGAAVLALAEVSIIRVRRSEVLTKVADGDGQATRLLDLLDELPLVLNSILFVVLLLQVSAATLGASLAARWFGGLGVSLGSIGLTLALFVYAEAIPKTLAVRAPFAVSVRIAPLLRVLTGAVKPVVRVLVALADLQCPWRDSARAVFTDREIMVIARESADAGQIEHGDADLVARSFYFNDRTVGDVMVQRREIDAVSVDDSVVAAMARATASGHRRLPVFAGDIDEIRGVVCLRDLASKSQKLPVGSIASLVTPALSSSPEEEVATLLRRMQNTHQSMAIVKDHTKRTLGLVTVEDLVEELMGELSFE